MSTAITGLPMSEMCSMPYPITLQGDCLMPAWRWIYKYSDLSAMAESQFSSFFVHRPWPKANFQRFSFVGHGRNSEFICFWFSAAAEMKFLLFFTRPPRRKAYFQHFLAFSRGWRTISMKIDDLPLYLNSFFWKSTIYYRIWAVFFGNWQFTIVFG